MDKAGEGAVGASRSPGHRAGEREFNIHLNLKNDLFSLQGCRGHNRGLA